MTDIVDLTQSYETWLHSAIDVIEPDLQLKHTELAASELRFLRGTYYYWLTVMPVLLPELIAAPTVPLVGDLHAENFGTWRDQHGERRWGVNDLDELGRGPYPIDLVRLAASCVLSPHVAVDAAEVCDILLDAWLHTIPGHAVKIDDAHHLHQLLPAPHTDAKYYGELAEGAAIDPATVPAQLRAGVDASVDHPWQPTWHHRTAGTGSLGHPRYVAVDAATAREVKVLGPPSAALAKVDACVADPTLYGKLHQALHGPFPATRIDEWQLRGLAPDVVRIEITALHEHDTERVLRSMAQSVIDVHGMEADALEAARADAAKRPTGWLTDAVAAMTADTRAAYQDWKNRS
jgi:hypothetical protein